MWRSGPKAPPPNRAKRTAGSLRCNLLPKGTHSARGTSFVKCPLRSVCLRCHRFRQGVFCISFGGSSVSLGEIFLPLHAVVGCRLAEEARSSVFSSSSKAGAFGQRKGSCDTMYSVPWKEYAQYSFRWRHFSSGHILALSGG